MPLREDLLTPIGDEKPSGEDLYYAPLFEQIKEARREDDDSIPEGAWERSQKKKADFRSVIRLAGDALAKRSKDLRLASWLIEAHIRVDGLAAVVPGIALLQGLQETFWPTLYPLPEEGEGYEVRTIAVEAAAHLMAQALGKVQLTSDGLTYEDYLQSRVIGYEKDATTDAKKTRRQEAIDAKQLTAEDFDRSFDASPKKLYVEAAGDLSQALLALDELDRYQQEIYSEEAPNLNRLRSALQAVQGVAESLLNERRKTEPDPVPVEEPAPEESGGPDAEGAQAASDGQEPQSGPATLRLRVSAGLLNGAGQAYAQVVESAVFLFEKNPASPVPYLTCAGLRMGETLMQQAQPAPGFAVGPSGEIRQLLRMLAGKGAWKDLLRESLPVLGSECARAWLDLHRYIWKAGQETGADAISMAVTGTVKNLLAIRPELRYWTLEDDTGAANPETQKWLDSTVLR